MSDLMELQNKIHQQNVEMGWHDEPRSFNTFVCLFHSELPEAMEGLRKNLMDDHLPHYTMVAVEVADFVIRVLDWFGTQQDLYPHEQSIVINGSMENIDYIAEMHGDVSAAKYFYDMDVVDNDNTVEHLSNAISWAKAIAHVNDWDLIQIINEKVEYNKTRADHKRENRIKDGGKKF